LCGKTPKLRVRCGAEVSDGSGERGGWGLAMALFSQGSGGIQPLSSALGGRVPEVSKHSGPDMQEHIGTICILILMVIKQAYSF